MNTREIILKNIAAHGHHVMCVGSSAEALAGFTYTIGLTGRYDIELIMFGIDMQIACTILNDIAADGTPVLDKKLDDYSNFPLVIKRCNTDAVRQYGIQADHFYGRPVKFAQVVLCDRSEKFPWDPGFSQELAKLQPLLFKDFS